MPLLEKYSEADELVVGCIDRGLDRVGPHVKYLVYWHLQKIGQIKRNEIIANPEKFATGLRGLYRESAAGVERAIIQELNATFSMNCPLTQLVPAITEARKKAATIKLI
ncbi:MAG TPA: hypothetical protein VED17_07780 [Nitrososphaerales archaeon]|nr:hypothetical protein [Nitrososphaerales archaeon]